MNLFFLGFGLGAFTAAIVIYAWAWGVAGASSR